jgi:hypothetical protein
MARNNQKSNPLVMLFFIAIIVALVVCFAPGMLIIGIAKYAIGFNLDAGQMWSMAVVLSLLLFGGIYFKTTKNIKKSLTIYGILSVAIIGFLSLLYYGLKLEFPVELCNYFFKK